jgi:hypothetical protein
VSYSIIHIPTQSSSIEINNLIVVFIRLQLTLGRVVDCIQNHVRLLDDLLNGAALVQEIVAGSILSITEILAIKNDKLHNTFLHVASGSQSLLNSTSDKTGSDTN